LTAGTAGSNPAEGTDVRVCVCVCVCDAETSATRRPKANLGCWAEDGEETVLVYNPKFAQ